jgi:hypothetical protein
MVPVPRSEREGTGQPLGPHGESLRQDKKPTNGGCGPVELPDNQSTGSTPEPPHSGEVQSKLLPEKIESSPT